MPLKVNDGAASISSNIEGVMVCPGEVLMLTCACQGTSQRWRRITGGAPKINDINLLFAKSDELGTQERQGCNFMCTLISTNFITTLSTVVTSAINNTIVECAGHSEIQ